MSRAFHPTTVDLFYIDITTQLKQESNNSYKIFTT